MIVAIKDANIIFDLFEMDLLELFLNLDYHFITSDLVNSEIKTKILKSKIENLKSEKLITIESLDYEQLSGVYTLKLEQPGLSIPDCSVIILAQKYNATVLSGDKLLRNKAKQLGLEYHGILWILDTLVEQQKITCDTACTKLRELMNKNNRLPISDCHKRLEKWNKK